MAQEIINVGTTANDGTGDTLRASQQKANANFTELYGATGTTPDATTTVKGKIKLAGDLGGTADAPTVPNKVDKTTEVNGHPLSGDVNVSLNNVTDVGNSTTNPIIVRDPSDPDNKYIEIKGDVINIYDLSLSILPIGIYSKDGFIIADSSTTTRGLFDVFSGFTVEDGAKAFSYGLDFQLILDKITNKAINFQYPTTIDDYYAITWRNRSGSPAFIDEINKPIKTIDLTSSDYSLIATDLDRYLFIQSGGIGSIFLPTDGTFENGDVIQIFNNDGATAIDPAPNSTALIGSDLILSLHTAYLKYNVDATLGNFWTVSYMTDGDNNTVDSVNGETGVVVLTQDDIADGTTYKQYSATEKSKLAGIATGATANDTDANLKNRANHTGTQTASTISDFNTAADARVVAGITGKEDVSNKENTTLDTSTTKYPTNKLVHDELATKATKSDIMRLTSVYAGSNSTSLQKMFNVGSSGNGSFNASANKTYRFRMEFEMTGLSSSTGTLSFGFLGTATISACNYKANVVKVGSLTAQTAAVIQSVNSSSATVVTANNVNTNAKGIIMGLITVTGAGTLIPAYLTSVGSASVQTEIDSFFEIVEIGSNTFTASSNII